MSKPKTYLLQNLNAGYLGNSPVFWAQNGGYTQWIDDAKRWTWKEAQATIRGTRGSHRWKAWDLAVIEAAAKRTVDIQDLQPKPRRQRCSQPRS